MTGKHTKAATLTIGVAQMALEGTLDSNRDKIIQLIGLAKTQDCRLIIFPEGALNSLPDTPKVEIDCAVADICNVARTNQIYVILCGMHKKTPTDRLSNVLFVINPAGEVILTYYKLFDVQPNQLPGVFFIDEIPCSAIICADRWIRGVEDLPVMQGARILIECSNNYATEWVPDLEWYWYIPRALRNNAYVIFANTANNPAHDQFEHVYAAHGHSAIINPEGKVTAAVENAEEKLLVATLDLNHPALGIEADKRRHHPLFQPFWDVGLNLLRGKEMSNPPSFAAKLSPSRSICVAAAQFIPSAHMATNLSVMAAMLQEAKGNGAYIVAFPELCVTGIIAVDTAGYNAEMLENALLKIKAAARTAHIAAIFGMPVVDNGKLMNGVYVVDAEGRLVTQYSQILVDVPARFSPGTSTHDMWFNLNGIPGVVTVGRREALWNEIAELAAIRGAQLHIHLENDHNVDAESMLLRKQIWVTAASYHTLTVTVNAGGGSTIWQDFRRQRGKGPYPYCAVPLITAGTDQEIIYTTQTVEVENPHYNRMSHQLNPQMKAWYDMGAQVIEQ
jgi:predicted amidohydrolase